MPVRKGIRVRSRGAKRMREMGYKLVSIWLDKHAAALVAQAAKSRGMKVATWIGERATSAAAAEVLADGGRP